MKLNKEQERMPLIPLRGLTVFPNMIIHFDVGRDQSLQAIEQAMARDERIVLVTQRESGVDSPKAEDLYTVGSLVQIKQIVKLKPPIIKVLVEAESRVQIEDIQIDTYMHCNVTYLNEHTLEDTPETEALIRTLSESFKRYGELNKKVSKDMIYSVLGADTYGEIMDMIIANLPLEFEKKQRILEELNQRQRIFDVIKVLEEELQLLEIQEAIQAKVQTHIDKHQKEYYLREQLKVIQEELGDRDGQQAVIDTYKQQIGTLNAPEDVKQKLEDEVERLRKVSTQSPEYSMLRNYIDTMLSLPWYTTTKEMIDLKKARALFEKEHYGLEQVKERIVEYLAVKKMAPKVKSPILCLVGPPGVGKTSIAKSVAEATGRNYVRIALGGVRDEAEIRGHRRTYVGAMPGRFIKALEQAGSSNPVMLLDEVDKMMGDFRGDPAAALLEILDSEQNQNFRDHYLELGVDLSQVLFVVTANTLSTIPRPLLDRMEIVEVSSYTAREKLEIAKRYLVPKAFVRHGLTKKQCKVSDDAISYIIDYYTREAGVRGLERQCATLCRKVTTELIEQDKKSVSITSKKVKHYLGIPKYSVQAKDETPQVGVVRGLAWTSVGGDTLVIEANVMPGRGTFELTGNMGNVMQESAKAAMSYIRSQAEGLDLDKDFYKKIDIHIHIPEGAVPKDGPSAGITMAVAIVSALTNKPVRNDIAMTGEVTIRGRVLAIGGLKEKMIAAKRAGIYELLIPAANVKNLEDISQDILDNMNVIPVQAMTDVLKHVFVQEEEEK